MYRFAAMATALVLTGVGLALLFAPNVQLALLGLEPDAGGAFMGRWSSPAFLALAGLIWGGRREPAGPMRRNICLGYGTMFVFFAVLGVKDLLGGVVSPAHLAAIAIEGVLAAALLLSIRRR